MHRTEGRVPQYMHECISDLVRKRLPLSVEDLHVMGMSGNLAGNGKMNAMLTATERSSSGV